MNSRTTGRGKVRFETEDAIDDLVIATDGPSLYVQAKRSLTLSTKVDSEFSKTLRQFCEQYLRDPEGDERFVLATTPYVL